jgi:hypothetical protein
VDGGGTVVKALAIGLAVLSLLVVAFGLGLRVRPAPFPPFRGEGTATQTIALPQGLPLPVERFYRERYGDRVPVVTSAVVSGRATLRLGGITFPGRFRFVHDAGRSYRHYLEATIYGFPVFRVNEWFVDGAARLELPFGTVAGEPKVDEAANLGLWAESLWLPSLFLTDERVRWEPVDDVTAMLVVPAVRAGEEERFVVRFDPVSGRPVVFESMRWKDAASQTKTLWINEARGWRVREGVTMLSDAALTWFDEGTPWAIFSVDEVLHNVDVAAALGGRGP